MKPILWQVVLVLGLTFIAIDLLINLLLPLGIILLIVSGILYLQSRSEKPHVIKK